AFQKRHRHNDLRRLTIRLLQMTTNEQVELLVCAAKLDIGSQRYGVVALHERVQKLVDRNRLARLVALAKVVPLEHPRNRMLRRELDQADGIHRAHPPRVELEPGERGI